MSAGENGWPFWIKGTNLPSTEDAASRSNAADLNALAAPALFAVVDAEAGPADGPFGRGAHSSTDSPVQEPAMLVSLSDFTEGYEGGDKREWGGADHVPLRMPVRLCNWPPATRETSHLRVRIGIPACEHRPTTAIEVDHRPVRVVFFARRLDPRHAQLQRDEPDRFLGVDGSALLAERDLLGLEVEGVEVVVVQEADDAAPSAGDAIGIFCCNGERRFGFPHVVDVADVGWKRGEAVGCCTGEGSVFEGFELAVGSF